MTADIPKYADLMRPVLKHLAELGGEASYTQLAATVADALAVDGEHRRALLPSGGDTVFDHEMNWAISYLVKADHLKHGPDGQLHLTLAGRDLLAEGREADIIPVRNVLDSAEQSGGIQALAAQLQAADDRLHAQVVERTHANSPKFFEQMIVRLLVAMGYGDGRQDAVRNLGQTGDGGVDGVIDLDPLGLDSIYFQAKRFKPGLAVPVEALRAFAGALEARKSMKGLFVSTSHFSRSAEQYVSELSRRVVLIDGARLVSLMMQYEVGVKVERSHHERFIDETFFPV